eukprot:COSAG01_NODE_52513_length_346_cov_0.813765_1_plen_72_part_01
MGHVPFPELAIGAMPLQSLAVEQYPPLYPVAHAQVPGGVVAGHRCEAGIHPLLHATNPGTLPHVASADTMQL